MRRAGGLFDSIADVRNLTAATWRAAQGKRLRPEVKAFLSHLDAKTARISRELLAGAFRFGGYREFSIRDPKSRVIHAPPFRDRVVHHAIVAIAGPVLERGGCAHTYACRAGRGQHAAIAQARGWMCRKDWFLKIDIAKYYDTVSHALLRERLARRFRERRLLALFDGLLASYEKTPGLGLPIGALTSQYLGNFFLDSFDHWVAQTCKIPRYLRYMDDMLFIADHSTLAATRSRAVEWLGGMGLKIKNGGVLNRCDLGVPWLGFTLYPDRSRLNPQGRRQLRRKLAALERAWLDGRLGDAELQARGEALFAPARCADDIGWRRMVLTFSRIREAQEPASCPPRRLLEQHGQELPHRDPQQERARQPEQEHRFPGLSGSRHEDFVSTDDAPSGALLQRGDETTRKTPPPAEIREEKAGGGAAREGAG